jgi:hypothetical protein
LKEFAEWLSHTYLSVVIQKSQRLMIPTIQSIHIAGIGIVMVSVLMVDLRILGWAGKDQTLQETTNEIRTMADGCAMRASWLQEH